MSSTPSSTTGTAAPSPVADQPPPGPAPEGAQRRSVGNRLGAAPWAELAAPIGLVVLVVVFGILTPTFLTGGNIEAILAASAILVVLAVGQTFVVATSGIDLSVASTMTLGAVVLGQFVVAGTSIYLACLAGIVAAALVGVVNGLLVARGKITDFIVTLATLSAASGLALVIADGKPQPVIDGFLLEPIFGTADLADFAELVVPELRRRGRMPAEPATGTLREQMLGRPGPHLSADHPGARFAVVPATV